MSDLGPEPWDDRSGASVWFGLGAFTTGRQAERLVRAGSDESVIRVVGRFIQDNCELQKCLHSEFLW